MNRNLFGFVVLVALVVLSLSATPAQAIGPYCEGYCSPSVCCSAACYTWSGWRITCFLWGEGCSFCATATDGSGTSGPEAYLGGSTATCSTAGTVRTPSTEKPETTTSRGATATIPSTEARATTSASPSTR